MAQSNVVVYSKENCMQCTYTKKFLENHNIPYRIKDVEENASALDEVKQLGFNTLPVITAEGFDAFHGFRPDILSKLA